MKQIIGILMMLLVLPMVSAQSGGGGGPGCSKPIIFYDCEQCMVDYNEGMSELEQEKQYYEQLVDMADKRIDKLGKTLALLVTTLALIWMFTIFFLGIDLGKWLQKRKKK